MTFFCNNENWLENEASEAAGYANYVLHNHQPMLKQEQTKRNNYREISK